MYIFNKNDFPVVCLHQNGEQVMTLAENEWRS